MKVLHIVPSFGIGGMEKVICSLIAGLGEPWIHEVVALNGSVVAGRWLPGGRAQLLQFTKPTGRLAFFQALYRLLQERAPVLLMTYNWGATDAIWLGRLAGVRNILHSEHGFNVEEAEGTLWKRNLVRAIVYRLASRVVVVSKALEGLMRDHFGLKPERVVFIPNGVNTDLYCPDRRAGARVREELGLASSDFVIGFAGRLDPIKNFAFMLAVLEECLKLDQRFRLVIIGEGPEEEKIRDQSLRRGLSPYVRLVGRQDDVVPYLCALDTFLLTSLREQMPISVLEAMAVEVPVVASAVGDLPMLIGSGSEGMILDLGAGPTAFSRALVGLVDEPIRGKMGRTARQKVVSLYSDHRMLHEYGNLIGSFA